MIAVVDYGMGNLRSVSKALERVGGRVTVTADPRALKKADKVVLPGVGAFRDAIANLEALGLDKAVVDAIEDGKPFLGICLGQQLLFERSYEDGEYKGLAVFEGEVVKFDADPSRPECKIPQIGWNRVNFRTDSPFVAGIPSGTFFYFVHSYYVAPDDGALVAGETEYLARFASAVARDNVFACQFHPEKSQRWGLKLLENFVGL
jgi:imidazole glycerol-phosphate synthase subunit HisH